MRLARGRARGCHALRTYWATVLEWKSREGEKNVVFLE